MSLLHCLQAAPVDMKVTSKKKKKAAEQEAAVQAAIQAAEATAAASVTVQVWSDSAGVVDPRAQPAAAETQILMHLMLLQACLGVDLA